MRNRQLTHTELWTILILFLAILFGGLVRFAPAVLSDFPINDGGMFYVMIEELQANHYVLPETTDYNGLKIPFVYPPLGFYLGGFVVDLFNVNIFDVLLWFPAVICTLSIFAFFLMAKNVLDSAVKGALAAFVFALMPRSFSWLLMGGGLTRSLGQLFFLLTVNSVYLVLARGSRRSLWSAMIFGGLVCLSHPENILHTAVICLLLVIFYVRSVEKVFDACKIAFGVLLVSSPWWITILLRHGVDPFLAASRTGFHDQYIWIELILLDFVEEKFVTLLTVLGLIGLGIQLFRKQYFLPLWLVIPFLIDPRSASSIAIMPLALMAAISLSDMILPGLLAVERGNPPTVDFSTSWVDEGMRSKAIRVTLGYIAIMALIMSYGYALSLSSYRLNTDDREAMHWVGQNTPPGARFLIVTGKDEPLGDLTQEWFPVLSGRQSLTTVQGLEWLSDDAFTRRYEELPNLQACTNRDVSCLSTWADKNDLKYDYVFIERTVLVPSYGLETFPELPAVLLNSLLTAPEYKLIYEAGGVLIFDYKNSSL